MCRDSLKCVLSKLRGHLHLRALAANSQRHLIAFFLRTDESLELLDVHNPLVAHEHQNVIFLEASFLRRAAIHDAGHNKTKALGQAHLRGQLRRKAMREKTEIRHRLAFRCFRMFPMLAAIVGVLTRPATLVAIVLGAVSVASTAAFAFVIAIRPSVAFRMWPRGWLGRLHGLLLRSAVLCARDERTRCDCAAREQKGCQFCFHGLDSVRVG